MYLLGTVLLDDEEVPLRSRREGKFTAQALLVAPSRARRVCVARMFTGWGWERP